MTSAPAATSAFTASVRPSADANISADWPWAFSVRSSSAPAAASARTMSALPDAAASISGVAPVEVRPLTGAPPFSSGAITVPRPFWPPGAAG